MTLDPGKLREFADTLTDDQVQLLREGLAEGRELDADELAAALRSDENHGAFKEFAVERTAIAAEAADGGTDGGTDAGTGDAGAGKPPPPPVDLPATRW